MFLPFLPMIAASVSLTLLSGVLYRPQSWLNIPLWLMLPTILVLSVILAQMPQKFRIFSRVKQAPLPEYQSHSSAKLTQPRIIILFVWLAIVYGEHLDLRLEDLFENSAEAKTFSLAILLLVYWIADAIVSVPVYQWNTPGIIEKFSRSALHLRLQLPVLSLIFIQYVWIWTINLVLPAFPSNWSLIFELLSSLILIVLLAPVVFVKSWGAQAIDKDKVYEEIRTELDEFRTPVAGILLWPDTIMPHSTAGVIGLLRGFRYLLISPKLLRSLSAVELRAVTAHEAGHIRRHHLFYYLLAFICLLELIALAGSVNLLLAWTGIYQVSGMLMVTAAIISILLFVRFGIGFLSQNFERQADCHAFERYGITPITTALLKVSWLNGINPEQDNWHHYGVRQRIEFLSNCLKNTELLQKHHQRVFRIKIGCALLALGLLGANFILSSDAMQTKVLAWKLEQTFDNWQLKDAPLLTKMGDLFYFQDQKDKAEIWYRRALELNPEEPRTLNNLAWLLTETHNNDQIRLKESMVLAQKALAGKQAAFIWDTLAEAYMKNGYYEDAADAALNALKSAEEGKGTSVEAGLDYYKKRFKQMAGE